MALTYNDYVSAIIVGEETLSSDDSQITTYKQWFEGLMLRFNSAATDDPTPKEKEIIETVKKSLPDCYKTPNQIAFICAAYALGQHPEERRDVNVISPQNAHNDIIKVTGRPSALIKAINSHYGMICD